MCIMYSSFVFYLCDFLYSPVQVASLVDPELFIPDAVLTFRNFRLQIQSIMLKYTFEIDKKKIRRQKFLSPLLL
jgi:hypothetical protein